MACVARTSFCATPSLSYFFMNTKEYDFGLFVLPWRVLSAKTNFRFRYGLFCVFVFA